MDKGLIRLPILWVSGLMVTAAVIAAAQIIPALATGVEGPTSFSGTSVGAVVGSTNKGSGAAVEAATGTVGGGQALVGVGTNAGLASLGVKGQVFGPASVGVFGEAKNTMPGGANASIGVEGSSKNANGVYAKTASDAAAALFANNLGTTTGVGIQAQAPGNAIVGTSLMSGGNGVVGVTATAAPAASVAGVMGVDQSTGFGNAGVSGTSASGYGVLGTSPGGSGVHGTSTFGNGVEGISGSGNGLSAFSTSGTGGIAISTHGNGAYIEGDATPVPSPTPGCCASIAALRVNAANGAPILIGTHGTTHEVSIDASGNMILAGTSTTSGSPLFVTRTTGGGHVGAYGGRQSQPTIEDFGEAQLTNGQAYVRLDPVFAAMIDARANYLVFITPQGSANSLYATNKTPQGFAVREYGTGRSSVAFDFRIVAKPADSGARRLPPVQPLDRIKAESPRLTMPRMTSAAGAAHFHIGYTPKAPAEPAIVRELSRRR